MVKVREALPLVDVTNEYRAITADDLAAHDRSSHSSTPVLEVDVPSWIKRLKSQMQVANLSMLHRATDQVKSLSQANESQRSSVYMTGIGIADILGHLVSDERVLVAAMLFRAAREQLILIDDIADSFDSEIATLVKDALAMGRLSDMIEKNRRLEDHFINNQKDHLAGIYKMLISVTNDVRVVLIKLAERTFAVRELDKATKERQQRVSREIMTIYAPLAHRLGIAQLKWELEDLAFRYLAPVRYKEIAKLLSEKRTEREAYIDHVIEKLEHALLDNNIHGHVYGRVKHIYSIYKKMKQKSLSFDQLYDIRALRVLVSEPADCYHVLGIVHGLWHHIPDQFDDYITNPKANGYRSLHTAVIAKNKSLEVQIRTHAMHFEAELGVCAHVNYKEGTKSRRDNRFDNRLNSLRQLLASYQDRQEDQLEPDDEDKPLQDWSELERIYVFTRDGDIQELPKESTVLDFAYHVHTEVGNHCAGARVNQKFVPLTYTLKTGEQVEIITRKDREPKRDWLVPAFGYIKSSRARAKLKHWFNQQDRGKNIQIGRDVLNQELVRLGLHPNSIDLAAYITHFNVNSADDILVGLVNGDIQLDTLAERISAELNFDTPLSSVEIKPSIHPKATGRLDAYKVSVEGVDNIDLHLAKCCYPLHGEPISGYITKQNGVSVHHRDCVEYARLIEQDPDREIATAWFADNKKHQRVQISVEAYDRRGLLKDLAGIIDKEHVNIVQVNTVSENDGFAHMTLDIEVAGLSQLSRLLAKLEQQPGIVSARRHQNSYTV